MSKHQRQSLTLDMIFDRCEPVGECYEWQQYVNKDKRPMARHEGAAVYVQRLVIELSGMAPTFEWHAKTTCNNPRCCNPAHLKAVCAKKAMANMWRGNNYQDPTYLAARQRAAAGRTKASAEMVQRILTDPRPAAHLAAEMGISRSLAQKIRAGKARKQVSASLNPFAGLIR
jgi:hypothetical protein